MASRTIIAPEIETRRALADRDWWQSLLPPLWRLYGWNDRRNASAYAPGSNRLVDIDGRLACDMRRRDYDAELVGANPGTVNPHARSEIVGTICEAIMDCGGQHPEIPEIPGMTSTVALAVAEEIAVRLEHNGVRLLPDNAATAGPGQLARQNLGELEAAFLNHVKLVEALNRENARYQAALREIATGRDAKGLIADFPRERALEALDGR